MKRQRQRSRARAPAMGGTKRWEMEWIGSRVESTRESSRGAPSHGISDLGQTFRCLCPHSLRCCSGSHRGLQSLLRGEELLREVRFLPRCQNACLSVLLSCGDSSHRRGMGGRFCILCPLSQGRNTGRVFSRFGRRLALRGSSRHGGGCRVGLGNRF